MTDMIVTAAAAAGGDVTAAAPAVSPSPSSSQLPVPAAHVEHRDPAVAVDDEPLEAGTNAVRADLIPVHEEDVLGGEALEAHRARVGDGRALTR